MLIGIGMVSGTRNERANTSEPGSTLHRTPCVQIFSRTLACLTLYLIHILFIYGVAYRVWRFPMRTELKTVFFYLLSFLLSVIMLGQMLAAFFKIRETAIVMIVWNSMIAVLASGFAWSVQSMTLWVRIFSMLLPST